MRAHFFREVPAVLFFSKADARAYDTKPNWMRYGKLRRTILLFEAAGLVNRIKGKKMPPWSEERSWVSSFLPTRNLIELAREHGLHPGSVGLRIPESGLVRLYSPKKRAHFDRIRGELCQPPRGPLIPFEPTVETEGWTKNLADMNVFYNAQDITLGLSDADLARWLEELSGDKGHKGPPFRLPEIFRNEIYRVFNNGKPDNPSFEQGGRLFGGWWMQVPETLRKQITINGEPVVEIDFKNCHPRMLYHKRGLEVEGDLYAIPQIQELEAENELEPGAFRSYAKWLMQVLINGRGRPEATPVPDDLLVPDGYETKQLADWIEAHHQLIADDFRKGAGLYLMRDESDIALEVIATAMKQGWVVLPVHDSFVTTTDRRDDLESLMVSSYFQRFGRRPELKFSDQKKDQERVGGKEGTRGRERETV